MKINGYWIREQWRWKRKFIKRCCWLIFFIWYLNALPAKLFEEEYATVVLSKEGDLLGAHIASDGQWRFPPAQMVPSKVAVCLVSFEDQHFYSHVGFSVKGIFRAFKQNLSKGKVVSGGSTITQQVVRIMRKNPPRTYSEKLLELLLATRLELSYSKDEILAMYVSHAPFGNNVVGLSAAAWRYFGRSPEKLSWAEAATLAVLPNAPGLIYPGKNHDRLLAKRNRLLKKLYENGTISQMTYALSLEEPLPEKPLALPDLAPHLLQDRLVDGKRGTVLRSTISSQVQQMVMHEMEQHAITLSENQIMNAAVVVTEVETGNVIAYVGNNSHLDQEFGGSVNCIRAGRSTGSVLKPILYAKALEGGLLTPRMLLSDIPSRFGSFSPSNFSGLFEGAVPANKALSRSLNIPMVHLLQQYGLTKFHHDLQVSGFHHVKKPAKHYGLSLILGGAEASLWEVNSAYTRMAQLLVRNKIKDLRLDPLQTTDSRSVMPMDRAAIYTTFEALIEVNRPDEENNWRAFESSQKIAWKTGTSFGFRDGWAVGVTPKYVVAVWVGNADGEGRPGLTGVRAAAPLLFAVFRQLPAPKSWFKVPHTEMTNLEICKESGHVAGQFCKTKTWEYLPKTCATAAVCPYHQLIHLDHTGTYRVTNFCEEPFNMKHEAWFVLPPMMERYFRANHPDYIPLPGFASACKRQLTEQSMAFLYPKPHSKIYIPIEIAGERGKTVFEVTHRQQGVTLFWHMDEQYIGSTNEIHQLTVQPGKGKHVLTIVDENGMQLSEEFEVL